MKTAIAGHKIAFALLSAVAVAIVAGAGFAGWHQYSKLDTKYKSAAAARDNLNQQVGALRGHVWTLQTRAAHLRNQVTELESEVTGANRRTANAKARAEAAEANATTTFDTGTNYGRESVFDSFDDWQVGNWYLIKIGQDEQGLNLNQRFDQIQPCQWMYLSNDRMYTQDEYVC